MKRACEITTTQENDYNASSVCQKFKFRRGGQV